jgi:hypothetical protein
VNNELGGGGANVSLWQSCCILYTKKKNQTKMVCYYFLVFFLKICQKKKSLGFWKNVVTFQVPAKAFCHCSVVCRKNCIIKKNCHQLLLNLPWDTHHLFLLQKKRKKKLSGCYKFGKMKTFKNYVLIKSYIFLYCQI